MARVTVRATFRLDVETARKVEQLTKQWQVSKSEAVRRAIHSAAITEAALPPALQAFWSLQRSLGLSKSEAMRWEKRIREIRYTSDRKSVV